MPSRTDDRTRITCLRSMLLLVIFLTPSNAATQDTLSLEKYIPADSLFYISIPGLPEAIQAVKAHPFSAMLEDDQFKAFLKPVLDRLDEASARAREQVGLTLKEMLAIPTGRIEIALMRVSMKDDEPVIDYAMNIEIRGGEEKALAMWKACVANAEKSGNVTIVREKIGETEAFRIEGEMTSFAFTHQGSFLMTSSQSLARNIVNNSPAPDSSLENDGTWLDSALKVKGESSHGYYTLNPGAFIKLGIENNKSDQSPEELELIFDKLFGISSFERVTGSFTFGRDGVSEILLFHVNAKRKGFFRLLDTLKTGLELPALLNPETVLYARSRLDMAAAFDTFMEISGDFMKEKDPEAYERFEQGLEAMDAGAMGFKLHDDFLDGLGEEVWLRMGLPRSGGFIPDILFGIELENPQTVMDLMDKLMNTVPEGSLSISIRNVKGNPVYLFQTGRPGPTPAVGILDDTLVLGISSRSVINYIRTEDEQPKVKAEKGRIPENLLASLGLQNADQLSGLVFGDLKRISSYLHANLTPRLTGLGPDSNPARLDPALFPTWESFARLFHRTKPLVWTLEITGNGVLMKLHSPISSMGLFGVLGGIGAILSDR